MRRSSYREQDHAFGQCMLKLRMGIGLSQAGLADVLHVSRRAVGGWEAGESYPKADHLQQFISLALAQGAFDVGREAEQIRELWRAAHQKVLLDEQWLETLLAQQQTPLQLTSIHNPNGANTLGGPHTGVGPLLDWHDAFDAPALFGRDEELALLKHWMLEERSRIVCVIGMGGIGKSALGVTAMRHVAAAFDVVLWRSLGDYPLCEAILDSCLQVLDPQSLIGLPDTIDARMRLLMEHLRNRRVLLVFDNWETLLEEGTGTSRLRSSLEGYIRLLRQIGASAHQSCLLLTSREKPFELISLEDNRQLIHVLKVTGLNSDAGTQLLMEKDLAGPQQDQEKLILLYSGNPLALKIVAQTIIDLFGGDVGLFLAQGDRFFGGVRQLLDEQFNRLSTFERNMVYWLAIMREPVALEELLAMLRKPQTPAHILEALDGLNRRSMIERGQRPGSFVLHPVVLEYATARMIAEASGELAEGTFHRLVTHSLSQARAKNYIRKAQEQVLLLPVLHQLRQVYPEPVDLEAHLLGLLDELRSKEYFAQGYGPSNILALLRLLGSNFRSLDLSHLALRNVSLQGIDMQDASLSKTQIQDSVFTEALDAVTAVAMSGDGRLWAAATWRGELRIWGDAGQTLLQSWQAHIESIITLAFSPDGRTLASGSWDATIKVWELASGALLWSGLGGGGINGVAFSPDGRLLASGGFDTTVRLWDSQRGTLLQELPHPGALFSLTWNPDGMLLVTGDVAGTIRLWQMQPGAAMRCIHTLAGHAHWVTGLGFSPDGTQIASGSFDTTVKLWDSASGHCLQTFVGHRERVMRLAWSPDGTTIASAGFDATIYLWNTKERMLRAVLQGHTSVVASLAFTPDSCHMLSGSNDGTMCLWEVATAQCIRVIHGYTPSLFDIDWSPDSAHLVSGGKDSMVTVWDVMTSTPLHVLRGHRWAVQGVAWNPVRHMLTSGGFDNSIGLWNPIAGVCLDMLHDQEAGDTVFQGITWSPDGQLLACGTYLRGVQVWDAATRTRRWSGHTQPTRIRRVAWSPTGERLIGGGDDGMVYVWAGHDGTLVQQLSGHDGAVMSVAWSPDGTRFASAGSGAGGGELVVWDSHSGKRVSSFVDHSTVATAVVWGVDKDILISGASDGNLRWWNMLNAQCIRTYQGHQGSVHALKISADGTRLASCGDDGTIQVWDAHTGEHLQTLRRDRPYERMDITGLTGLSDAQRASLITLGAIDRKNELELAIGACSQSPAIPSRSGKSEPRMTDHRQVILGFPLQPTAYIGRSTEQEHIARLLAGPACRLLTLLGIGGMGKTRLAIQVASALATTFPDGVAFVALDSVGSPNQIADTISATLNLSFNDQPDPTARLLSYLADREMLLVLDNFEHLLEGADLVAAILAQAPRITVLVTSRERLSLQSEWLFDLDGLAYPPEEGSNVASSQTDLADYSAVQLFIQEATRMHPKLVLTQAAFATIGRICSHVAGIPLAIELAAANACVMSLDEIEGQVRSNLDVLATKRRDVPARHRSMRAIFDHSWNMLNEPERVLFSRLAVFCGGWTLAAAINVANATPQMLTALVDTSLVVAHEPTPNVPESRFALLVPMREYALKQLVARGELATFQHAHAIYYLAFAEAIAAQWDDPAAEEGMAQFQRDYDNLRAALRWACEGGDRTLGLRLAGALRQYWHRRWYHSEGLSWLETLLVADDRADTVPIEVRVDGLDTAASLASDQHDYVHAVQLFAQSTALRRSLGMDDSETHNLGNAARQARAAGHYAQAAALLEELVAYHRAHGDRGRWTTRGLGMTLYELGMVCRERGDFARARSLFTECIAFHREIGDDEGIAIGLLGLGDVARDQGDLVQLFTWCEESLAMLRRLGVTWATGFALNNLALGACLARDLMRASDFANESLSLFAGVHSDIMRAEVLITWGRILLARGDHASAYAALAEAVQLTMTSGPRLMVAYALEGVAATVIAKGDAHLAVQCLVAASVIREQLGTPLRPIDQAPVETTSVIAQSILGPDAFTQVWNKSHDIPLEQLLAAISSAASANEA